MAQAGLWSGLAFVLNLTWEIAHVRLYAIWAEADGVTIAWSLLHCSLGDVVIALAMFALAGIGLSPLLQWLILPPVMVGDYRRLGPELFGRRSSQVTSAPHDTAGDQR